MTPTKILIFVKPVPCHERVFWHFSQRDLREKLNVKYLFSNDVDKASGGLNECRRASYAAEFSPLACNVAHGWFHQKFVRS